MRHVLLRISFYAFLALVASSASAEVSVVDGRGKAIRLPAFPRRIVSLSPGTTEMLFAMGLKDRVVADTSYCDFPPEARKLPHVGDVTISAEKVIAQRPDLVVASGSANRSAIPTLERLQLKVFAVDPTTLEETYRAISMLGAITGNTHEATQVVQAMRDGVKRAQSLVPRRSRRPKVLWIVQADPLIVVGAKSFMDDLITLAAAENLGRQAGSGWPTLSPARVVALQPDVILAGHRTAERLRSRPGWGTVPAVRNNRVVLMAGDESARPGPRLIGALRALITHLYGPAAPARR